MAILVIFRALMSRAGLHRRVHVCTHNDILNLGRLTKDVARGM